MYIQIESHRDTSPLWQQSPQRNLSSVIGHSWQNSWAEEGSNSFTSEKNGWFSTFKQVSFQKIVLIVAIPI